MINVNDRDIVVPGQLLGQDMKCEGPCVTEEGKTYATVKGLARVDGQRVSVIPLNGAYKPKVGDVVIGVVSNDLGSVYFVDMDCPYTGILRPRRANGGGRGRGRGRDREPESFEVGQIVSAKIAYVDEVYEAQLTGPRVLEAAHVMHVKPKRVPRIIGRKKSMITLIRENTRSRISVGQNGIIWIKDGNVELAVKAIRMVEEQAHTSGLTDRMTQYLKSESNSE